MTSGMRGRTEEIKLGKKRDGQGVQEKRKCQYTAVGGRLDPAGESQRQSQGPRPVRRETLVLMRSGRHTLFIGERDLQSQRKGA